MARPPEQQQQDTPSHEASEAAVLGHILRDPKLLEPVSRFLPEVECFHNQRHQTLYLSLREMAAVGEPINTVSVMAHIRQRQRLAAMETGGESIGKLLVRLGRTPPFGGTVEQHASKLAELWRCRRMMTDAMKLYRVAQKGELHDSPPLLDSMTSLCSFPNGTVHHWGELEDRPIAFLWSQWLAYGYVHLFAGMSGSGKSQVLMTLCASFINGTPWPDGSPFLGAVGKVLWCESEDGQFLNKSRAQAHRVSMDAFYTPLGVEQNIDLDNATHRAAIASAASRDEVKVIVVDSLSGSTNKDENKTEAKAGVAWLASLARQLNKPVIVTHHLRKKREGESEVLDIDRLRGHSSIVQPSRAVWGLERSPDDPTRRTFKMMKTNLSDFPEPLGVTVENGVTFDRCPPKDTRKETAVDRCMDKMRLWLSQPLFAEDVKRRADNFGIPFSVVMRAADRLKVVRTPQGKSGLVLWGLPDD